MLRHTASRRPQAGTALIMVLFSVAALSLTVATALLVCSADVLATRNYTHALQVHLVAESAVAEALQLVNEDGVSDFKADVVKGWARRWGKARTFAPIPTLSYDVSASADAKDAANAGRFVATATGRDLERNVVVANVARVALPARAAGALFLTSNDAGVFVLKGASLSIEGTDQKMPEVTSGGSDDDEDDKKDKDDKKDDKDKKDKKDKSKMSAAGAPAGMLTLALAAIEAKTSATAPPVLGIATRSDVGAQVVLEHLDAKSLLNVRGVGFMGGEEPRPSVASTAAAPSAAHLEAILTLVLSRPSVVVNGSSSVSKEAKFGTRDIPAITYLNSAKGLVVDGTARGAGILVAEEDVTVHGTLEFDGLLILRGRMIVDGGKLQVYGSLWTPGADFVGGNVTVAYSTEALALAAGLMGTTVLPAPVVVTSLADCSALAKPANGCP